MPQRNKIPIEYMIVEVIFSELFQMPSPRYLEISYGSTLIELCKLNPGTMPQVIVINLGRLKSIVTTLSSNANVNQ